MIVDFARSCRQILGFSRIPLHTRFYVIRDRAHTGAALPIHKAERLEALQVALILDLTTFVCPFFLFMSRIRFRSPSQKRKQTMRLTVAGLVCLGFVTETTAFAPLASRVVTRTPALRMSAGRFNEKIQLDSPKVVDNVSLPRFYPEGPERRTNRNISSSTSAAT